MRKHVTGRVLGFALAALLVLPTLALAATSISIGEGDGNGGGSTINTYTEAASGTGETGTWDWGGPEGDLTLNNYTGLGVRADGDLTINLEGDNQVDTIRVGTPLYPGPNTSDDDATLTLVGVGDDASLTIGSEDKEPSYEDPNFLISSGDMNIENLNLTLEDAYIVSGGTLSITDSEVDGYLETMTDYHIDNPVSINYLYRHVSTDEPILVVDNSHIHLVNKTESAQYANEELATRTEFREGEVDFLNSRRAAIHAWRVYYAASREDIANRIIFKNVEGDIDFGMDNHGKGTDVFILGSDGDSSDILINPIPKTEEEEVKEESTTPATQTAATVLPATGDAATLVTLASSMSALGLAGVASALRRRRRS